MRRSFGRFIVAVETYVGRLNINKIRKCIDFRLESGAMSGGVGVAVREFVSVVLLVQVVSRCVVLLSVAVVSASGRAVHDLP